MRAFLTFFVMQWFAFLILVTNLRAISHLQYVQAALTETLYLIIQWTLLKKVVGATSRWEQAGYVLGGVTGTLLSMWLTRSWG